jgi:uncharacterized membrane protein
MVTGLGLSAAAGLNAYIPILVIGLLGRYSDVVTVPAEFSWMTNGWALIAVAVLLTAEVVLDKIAVVDHVNDAIQTFVRPAAGGAVFAASNAAAQLDSSSFMRDHSWIGWSLGMAVALVVHTTKATVRPVVNGGTLGTGTPVVSALEDTISLGMSLLAILLPVAALIFLIILVYAAMRLLRRLRARRRRRRQRTAAHPDPSP